MKKSIKCVLAGAMVVMAMVGAVGTAYSAGKANSQNTEVVEEPKPQQIDLKLPGETEKRVVTRMEIEGQLEKISEFATYSYRYSVERSMDQSRYMLDDIPVIGTKNKLSVQCDGVVKTGYDVTQLEPEVDNVSYKIYISIPEIEVLDNYIIWDSVRCQEENNVLNPIDFSQYKVLINELEAYGLKQAEEAGIYQSTEEHFKTLVKEFLSEFEGYEVVFM